MNINQRISPSSAFFSLKQIMRQISVLEAAKVTYKVQLVADIFYIMLSAEQVVKWLFSVGWSQGETPVTYMKLFNVVSFLKYRVLNATLSTQFFFSLSCSYFGDFCCCKDINFVFKWHHLLTHTMTQTAISPCITSHFYHLCLVQRAQSNATRQRSDSFSYFYDQWMWTKHNSVITINCEKQNGSIHITFLNMTYYKAETQHAKWNMFTTEQNKTEDKQKKLNEQHRTSDRNHIFA